MSRAALPALTAVLAACIQSPAARVAPEQVAVYTAGNQPEFDSSTHRVAGHFVVTGGGTVTNARLLRNVQVEAARRGAEYVILMEAGGASQWTFSKTSPGSTGEALSLSTRSAG